MLMNVHPWLMPILQEHLDDNECVLPHVLLADVERWTEARLRRHGETDEQLSQLLSFLESEYLMGHPHVQELISVSFLEHIPRGDDPAAALRSLVGPCLTAQLDIIG